MSHVNTPSAAAQEQYEPVVCVRDEILTDSVSNDNGCGRKRDIDVN